MKVTETRLATLIDNLNTLICEDDLLTRPERETLVQAVAAIGAMKARVSMKIARKSVTSSQCVVADLPSMIPAAVSKKAPVHTDAVIVVVNACLAIHSSTFCFSSSALTTPPGTIRQSISG